MGQRCEPSAVRERRNVNDGDLQVRPAIQRSIAGDGAIVFAPAERMGLEGSVSKRLGSHYRSGRVDNKRKVKCWTESALTLIGTELNKLSGAPMALLARQSEEGLSFAGGAFFALKDAQRGFLRDRLAGLAADRSPIPALRKRDGFAPAAS